MLTYRDMNWYNVNGKITGHSTIKCKCWGGGVHREAEQACRTEALWDGVSWVPGEGSFQSCKGPRDRGCGRRSGGKIQTHDI